MGKINYQKDLNAEQLAVVKEGDGPCLVLAGAGSGKTRTIIYRVAYLIEQGVDPENILLLTFTNKAAGEMTQRLRNLVGDNAQGLWSGTFHSIANRLLRHFAHLVGHTSSFSILDRDDSKTLIKACIKESGADKKKDGRQRFPSPAIIQEVISYSRNAGIALLDGIERKYPNFLPLSNKIIEVADLYTKKKRDGNAMDFDDLLSLFLELLDKDPQVRMTLQKRFKHILVDEYQDTNFIQSAIISRLVGEEKPNVLAVGDDAQSIYSFRAADVRNILDFPKHFPGTRIFKMTTNYRSTPQILDLANEVISHNTEQFQKDLDAIKKAADRPKVMPTISASREAKFIADQIEKKLDDGMPASEIAVLFRATFHSQQLEFELMRRGIEYDYRGGMKFFERAHIKDALAFLRIRANPQDEASWLRILTMQEGIGDVTAGRIANAIREEDGGLAKAIMLDVPSMFGDRASRGWSSLRPALEALHKAGDSPTKQLREILKSSYVDYLESEYPNFKERLEDLEQLAIFSERYEDVTDFLAEVALDDSAYGTPSNRGKKGSTTNKKAYRKSRVVLSTVHQAKGLEWDTVFVIHLTATSFPNRNALMEDGGLEEERRLFYVAVTRAKNNLYLTHPSTVGRDFSFEGPSRFLEEVDPNCLDGSCSGFPDMNPINLQSKFVNRRAPVDDYSQPGYSSSDDPTSIIVLDSNGERVSPEELKKTKEKIKKTNFLGNY